MMERNHSEDGFIEFLQETLEIPSSAIAVALRYREQDLGPLPMIFWKYGLVSIEELDRILDWTEE